MYTITISTPGLPPAVLTYDNFQDAIDAWDALRGFNRLNMQWG